MIIKGIEHVAINVSDIEKATKFYRDVLGFPYRETMVDGAKDLVYFDMPGGVRLELFNYHGKALKPAPVESEYEALGYVHLAFLVDNVDEWAKHFAENDVRITYGPADVPHLGIRACLFADPDGNIIEICTML